jgi:hypothetical protein
VVIGVLRSRHGLSGHRAAFFNRLACWATSSPIVRKVERDRSPNRRTPPIAPSSARR